MVKIGTIVLDTKVFLQATKDLSDSDDEERSTTPTPKVDTKVAEDTAPEAFGGSRNESESRSQKRRYRELGGGFKYFLFSPLFGEIIQFDKHIFQMG